jgi:uncharacterized protein
MNVNGLEPLFKVKVTCKNCDYMFETSRVRPSFKKSVGSESDFYVRYKEINPEYYVVRVCPFCGFATTENFSDKISPGQKGEFELRVRTNWSYRDFGGERSWPGEGRSGAGTAISQVRS